MAKKNTKKKAAKKPAKKAAMHKKIICDNCISKAPRFKCREYNTARFVAPIYSTLLLCRRKVHKVGPTLTNLLPPHCIIKSLCLQQCSVRSLFYHRTFFQHINGIGMHNGRKPVGNQNRYLLAVRRDAANGTGNFFFGE